MRAIKARDDTHVSTFLEGYDHPLVLESISTLLEPHFTTVGRVQHSGELIVRAMEVKPDVILIDDEVKQLDAGAHLVQDQSRIAKIPD